MRQILLLFTVMIRIASLSADYEKTERVMMPSESSTTEHEVQINGQNIPYQAVAGNYQLKDENGTVKAEFFYIAYTRTDVSNKSKRPIGFSFNGGPGSSSVWMHMGFLGPKKVNLNKESFNQSDNPYSLLDVMDIVFIDPIATGYSRVSGGEDAKQYFDVDEDVKSIAEFIRAYVTEQDRWESPKFLVGASYGTMRAVQLAHYLFQEFDMVLNGIVLISSVLDFQTIDAKSDGNEITNILFLPSYTAVAWFYEKLAPELQENLQTTLSKAKGFAFNEYALALLRGKDLSQGDITEIAKKLSYFTGLSIEDIMQLNLRIKPENFMKGILVKESKIVGRFDGRISGDVLDKSSEHVGYDPSMDTVFSNFKAVFSSYLKNSLNWNKIADYRVLTDVHPWNYSNAKNRYYNATPRLRELMIRIPAFKVFVASGFFDLATPFLGTDYTFSHLWLPQELNKNLHMKNYPAGHMIYLDSEVLKTLSADLHAFISDN